jgi:hypothetical protein
LICGCPAGPQRCRPFIFTLCGDKYSHWFEAIGIPQAANNNNSLNSEQKCSAGGIPCASTKLCVWGRGGGGRRRGANQSLVAALPADTKLERERCCDLAHTMLVIHDHGGEEDAANVGDLIQVVLEEVDGGLVVDKVRA